GARAGAAALSGVARPRCERAGRPAGGRGARGDRGRGVPPERWVAVQGLSVPEQVLGVAVNRYGGAGGLCLRRDRGRLVVRGDRRICVRRSTRPVAPPSPNRKKTG